MSSIARSITVKSESFIPEELILEDSILLEDSSSEDKRDVVDGKEEAGPEKPVPAYPKLSFKFRAPLPYKEIEFPNVECWPDGKKRGTRESRLKDWEKKEANFQGVDNAMIQKKVKLIKKKLLERQNEGSWIKEVKATTYLRSARVQVIDEEFKAGRLFPMQNGSHGLCYSCGNFYPVNLFEAEHVQPQNTKDYSIIERQKRFLETFNKIKEQKRDEILAITKAKKYIIVIKKNELVTKNGVIIGSPMEKGEISENTVLRINELFLRSYLNDMSNLICACGPCNSKTYHDSMEEKLRNYPLLNHKKARQAFDFSLNKTDIMYTSQSKNEGLGRTIINWVNNSSEGNLFEFLKNQFFDGLKRAIPRTPLTSDQQELRNRLIKKSPERYKKPVEENIEDVILGMQKMGISEKAVQEFLLAQWKGPKAKRVLFLESAESSEKE